MISAPQQGWLLLASARHPACPVPCALCPVPCALCPVPNALTESSARHPVYCPAFPTLPAPMTDLNELKAQIADLGERGDALRRFL